MMRWKKIFQDRKHLDLNEPFELGEGIIQVKPDLVNVTSFMSSKVSAKRAMARCKVVIPVFNSISMPKGEDNRWKNFWLALSIIPQQLAYEVEALWLINNRFRFPSNHRGIRATIGPDYPFNTEKCTLCGAEEETWEHLFVNCNISRQVFDSILGCFFWHKSSVPFPESVNQALCPKIKKNPENGKIIIRPFIIQVVYTSVIFRWARSRRSRKARVFQVAERREIEKISQNANTRIKLAFEILSSRRKEKGRT